MSSFDKSSDPEAVKATPVAVNDNDSAVVGEVEAAEKFAFAEDRKIGITGAVFLILNKMIGTGIFSTPSAIFQATGSVGVSLFLWIIGKFEPQTLFQPYNWVFSISSCWDMSSLLSGATPS